LNNLRKHLRDWLIMILAWQLASFIFTAIGLSFINTFLGILEFQPTALNNDFYTYSQSSLPLIESGLFGFFFGSFFYIIHWATENTRIRNMSFGKVILVQSVSYFFAFVVVFFLVYLSLMQMPFFPIENYDQFITLFGENPAVLVSFLGYMTFVIVIINFFVEVSKKFGPGNLWNLFIGKYHSPKAENKIFMFLDLKDSTGYAEKLGHIKYSQLIQNCFLDLNGILDKFNAQVYQYVGDEAVLMWDKDQENAANDAIKLYYAFQALLTDDSEKYKSKFGLVPEFKAGINEGTVTAAEVGSVKREIAFHGDVLNTAARIQKVCNQYKKNLLSSESFVEFMGDVDEFKKVQIGYIPLKGKSVPVNIYSIEPV
jgi:adenylate cyclase